jgi:tetratricopeptide (TPR) repeat protein
VASGELSTVSKTSARNEVANTQFAELLNTWSVERSVENAADVLSAGVVLNKSQEILQAAEFLADPSVDVAPLVKQLAERVLSGSLQSADEPPVDEFARHLVTLRGTVAIAKVRTRREPRNAIAWMDLAHGYTVLGQHEKAGDAVRKALALSPENRFVLRSAARFYVHADKPEVGLEHLRRSRIVKVDPWVMAAEIAMSSLLGQSPRSYRGAVAMADADAIDPWHTAELHGAMGTLAILDRGLGKARKFFRKSLRDPTENAIAQAQWAANGNQSLKVEPQIAPGSGAFEAEAMQARTERRWRDAIEACRAWGAMEPTSTRPLLNGAFIAEAALGDGALALPFTAQHLITAPQDKIALNNHVVALAYTGNLDEANHLYEVLARQHFRPEEQIAPRATGGLLKFRAGDLQAGERLYSEAFEMAMAIGDRELAVLVLWHLLREQARMGMTGVAAHAELLSRKTSDLRLPELAALAQTVDNYLKVSAPPEGRLLLKSAASDPSNSLILRIEDPR